MALSSSEIAGVVTASIVLAIMLFVVWYYWRHRFSVTGKIHQLGDSKRHNTSYHHDLSHHFPNL